MIDHEKQVYTLVSNALKEKFETIQTTDQKLRFYDSTYPVISLIQTDNYVLQDSRSFRLPYRHPYPRAHPSRSLR